MYTLKSGSLASADTVGDGLTGGRAQPGGVGVALRGEDVLGDEAHEQPPRVLGEARHRVERRGALGLLAPGVVGQRVVERGGQVGRLAHEVVVDRHRVGDAGEAAGAGRAQAEQAHQVGPVGVVVERDAAELVAAHGRVVDRLALVGDVAQHVAVLVLRPGLAEMQPDAPVQEREVVVAVAPGVQGGDAGEAAAVEEDVDDAVELGGQAVEREVLAPELEGVGALLLRRGQRGVELGVVGRAQPQRPRLRVGDVGRPPLGRRLELVHVTGVHVGSSRPARRRALSPRPGRAAPAARPSAPRLDT